MKRSQTIGTIRKAYGYTRKEAIRFYQDENAAIKSLCVAIRIEQKQKGLINSNRGK